MEENKPPLPFISSLGLTEQQIKEMTVQADPLSMAYVNHCRLTIAFTEIRLFFGQNTINALGQPKFTEDFCVVLAPEFARVLADILAPGLNMYEEKFGKLRPKPTPPSAPAAPTLSTAEPSKENK